MLSVIDNETVALLVILVIPRCRGAAARLFLFFPFVIKWCIHATSCGVVFQIIAANKKTADKGQIVPGLLVCGTLSWLQFSLFLVSQCNFCYQ